MSKIIRLNNETIKLIEELRRDLKLQCDQNEMSKSIKDILDKDNIVIQSALTTAIEMQHYFY